MIINPFENLNNIIATVNQNKTSIFVTPATSKDKKSTDPFDFIKTNYVTKKASYKKTKITRYVQK